MKLASYKNGRDGTLMLVSKDLKQCVRVGEVAPTMQAALDNWQIVAPKLKDLSAKLNAGELENAEAFDQAQCASPLPRAYQIADGSAYLNHVELVRKARGAEMPESFLTDPLMYQAVSDTIIPPHDPIPIEDESYGIDFEAEVGVIVDDTPMGVSAEEAKSHIKLVMLMNDVSLRALIPAELGKGFGFFNSKPPSAFSPVAVTPDELGDKWDGGKINLPLISVLNDKEFGRPNAGLDANFDLAELVAHAAKTRPLGAGAIVASGTISNKDASTGFSCIAEVRMIEKIETGEFKTPFMKFGDRIKIEMLDEDGVSIFGRIDQEVIKYERS